MLIHSIFSNKDGEIRCENDFSLLAHKIIFPTFLWAKILCKLQKFLMMDENNFAKKSVQISNEQNVVKDYKCLEDKKERIP